MWSGAVPVFFNVDVNGALLEPTLLLGKVIVDGVKVTSGAFTPEPLSGRDCGLPVALSVMVSAAVRVPATVGVKITEILQAEPPGMLPTQLVCGEKSPAFVPVMAMFVMFSVPEPLLVNVIF